MIHKSGTEMYQVFTQMGGAAISTCLKMHYHYCKIRRYFVARFLWKTFNYRNFSSQGSVGSE